MEFKILDIIQASPRVRRFILEPLTSGGFSFLPGQFIILKLQHAQGEWMERSYSIASKFPGEPVVELCIALNEKGRFTPQLFELKTGATIEGTLPQGQFTYKADSAQALNVFICTGTGIAPFRNMVRQALTLNHHNIHLVYGNRFQRDQLYHDEWLELAQTNPRFFYHPVLSREDMQGFNTGYVHPIYEEILSLQEQAHMYVCGWKDMLVEARQRLKALGFTRKQYHFEQYD